jgi:serine/threonine protein kinase/Tfp pilus assembly protein PilF
MAEENWQKVREVFDSALARPPGERQNFVNEVCGDDKTLLAEVESLLLSLDSAEGFMETPAVAKVAGVIDAEIKRLEGGQNFGHYEIIEQIGEGGMGEVYLAKDTRLNRQIALKLLGAHITEDKNRASRFRQEAFATSALNHPNIVTIYEIGEWQGRAFIATEFVDGITLRRLLRKKKPSVSEALDLALQIAGALSAAHGAGIIHRDIKPENIMIRSDGLVKILDFGIAKYMPSANGRRGLVETEVGEVIGTTAYMSPEQARGLEIDQRTDIWSLGVILYEMIAGKLPFAGKTKSDRIAAILEHEPLPLTKIHREVPPELEQITGHALAKNKKERYAKAADLAEDLRRLRETTADKNPSSFVLRARRSAAPRRAYLYAASALAVLLVVGIGFGYFWWARKMSSGANGKKSIAVLPLKPINTAGRDEIYELGIADSVILKISSSRNLSVRQLHAVRNYVELDRDLIEIGKEQNVDFVLASNYQIANGKIKVTSQLLDVATGKVEDTFTVEKDSTNLFSAQDAIAAAIGSKLIARFGGANNGYEPKRGTNSEEAYRLYLQGMYLVEKGDKAGTIRSIELFDQAINLDPNYAAAWAGKGHAHCAYSHMGDNPPAAEYKIAGPAIARALELDSNLSEAYAVLGIINTDFYWNFAEGEKHFLRAIELNPSSDYAYRWYGNRMFHHGRTEEADAAMKTAIDNNPTSIFHHRIYGWVLYMARRHDEAIEELKRVVEMDPGFVSAYDNLWLAYHAKGDHARAFEWFMKYHEQAHTSSELITQLNAAYQNSGWQGVLQRHRAVVHDKAQKGEYSPRYYRIAVLSALVGDKDQALESLNEAFKYRSANITFLKTDPALDSLRGDPRFNELMQRAGFWGV